MGIAEFLVSNGYVCWIMEWRSHGESSIAKEKFNFETISEYEFPAVFEFLFSQKKIQNLSCITHSGGGINLTMFLIKNQDYLSKIDSITFFGCQAFGAAHSLKNYVSILIGKYISAMLGKIPAQKAGAKAHNETYFTMKQWFNWNLHKNFLGKNQFDFLPKMKLVTTPILSICGGGDTFIAPKYGCEQFLNAFQNENNKLLYFAVENGNREDYNHSRLLLSRNAQTEIWPVVLDWIEKNS